MRVQSLKGHKSPYKSYWGGWTIDERVVWVNNRKNRKSRAYLMKKGENRLIIFVYLPPPGIPQFTAESLFIPCFKSQCLLFVCQKEVEKNTQCPLLGLGSNSRSL